MPDEISGRVPITEAESYARCGKCGKCAYCKIVQDYCLEIRQSATRSRQLTRLRSALTPSEETKYAYSGEFGWFDEAFDDDGNSVSVQRVVPWETIKRIMARILAKAEATESVSPGSSAPVIGNGHLLTGVSCPDVSE